MSLRPPRRIFARRSRTTGTASAVRTLALLALGFVAAFGATVVAAAWPRETTLLEAGFKARPATRLAAMPPATRPERDSAGEPGRP